MNSVNRLIVSVVVGGMGLGLVACGGNGPVTPAAAPAVAVGNTGKGSRERPEFPGFRRVVRNDVEYFCQTSTPTGSRTRRGDQCYTRAELAQMEQANRDMFKDAGGGSSHDTLKMDAPR